MKDFRLKSPSCPGCKGALWRVVRRAKATFIVCDLCLMTGKSGAVHRVSDLALLPGARIEAGVAERFRAAIDPTQPRPNEQGGQP